jgi:hypothetical protein
MSVESIINELGGESPQTRAIAEGLVSNGISSTRDIGVRQIPNMYGYGDDYGAYQEIQIGTKPEFYNKTTNQIINPDRIAGIGDGNAGVSGGHLFFNLNVDESGNINFLPKFVPKARGWLKDFAPILAIAAIAIPGIGEAVGYAILGAGDAVAGAALAGEIAVATGVSTITAASVAGATGAATISAGLTAAQGGDGADIVRAAATAGAASITNVAAGGGIVGAGAGSAVGTAIAGGNLDQVTLNVVASVTGAAVGQQLGPAAGAIATDLVKTGNVSDATLVKAAFSEANVKDTSKSGASKIESLYDRLTAPPVKPGSEPFTIENATYQELQDGSAKVTRGSNVTIMSPDNFADVKEQQLQNIVSTPVSDSSETLPAVKVTAPNVSNVESVVTDVADNTASENDKSTKLEKVTVIGKREDSNTSPVVAELDTANISGKKDPGLDQVTVAGEDKKEKPEDEEKTPPDELYPTITSFSKKTMPPTITGTTTGASPARLLADALAAYRPPGAVEGVESGKEREPVWNTESLRNALGI